MSTVALVHRKRQGGRREPHEILLMHPSGLMDYVVAIRTWSDRVGKEPSGSL